MIELTLSYAVLPLFGVVGENDDILPDSIEDRYKRTQTSGVGHSF